MGGESFEARRARALQDYPLRWRQAVSAWRAEGPDAAWLIYSANYLLRTAGVRWVIDPMTVWARLGQPVPLDLAADLAGLDWIVLTHAHKDHFNPRLLFELSRLPARWVAPEFLLPILQPLTGLPASQWVVARPGLPLELGNLRLTPCEGIHWHGHPKSINGLPALGYLAEFSGRRWLFPGDTRTYAPGLLPRFAGLDGAFVHLWLGKGRALDEQPPLLDDFCRFVLELGARQAVLTHLEEWGRPPEEFWGARHGRLVQSRLAALAPDLPLRCATTGEEVFLR